MSNPLPYHEPLVDPKTGKINFTSSWAKLLSGIGVASAEIQANTSKQLSTLISTMTVGSPGGLQIAPNSILSNQIQDEQILQSHLGGAVVTNYNMADFAVDAKKQFSQVPWFDGDIWTNNDPVAGSISWNAHTMTLKGTVYNIEAGSTSATYVWWDSTASTTQYQTASAAPALGLDQFIVATNIGGAYDLGYQHIANLTVGDAQIINLNADKIYAGTITGRTLQTAFPGQVQRFVVSSDNNLALWYGDRGDGQSALLATIGQSYIGPPVNVSLWSVIAWNGSVFCALADGTNTGAISSDGITWTKITLPTTDNWRTLVWNGVKFCAVAWGSDHVMVSTDGVHWSQSVMPASRSWNGLAWNGTTFVAVAYASKKAAVSTDGLTWTEYDMQNIGSWSGLAWNAAAGKFCTVSYSGNKAEISSDGTIWNEYNLPASNLWCAITSDGTKFVAVAGQGASTTSAATSYDGQTWVAQTLPFSSPWSNVNWNGNEFLATSWSSASGAYSYNGSAWNIVDMHSNQYWWGTAWNNEVWVALATNMAQLSSAASAGFTQYDSISSVILAGNTTPGNTTTGITATGWGTAFQAQTLSPSSGVAVYAKTHGIGVLVSSLGTYGILCTAVNGYGIRSGGLNNYFNTFYDGNVYAPTTNATPLVLQPASAAGAPTHSSFKGSLWVDSNGILYINTNGSTTWGKVGAQ